MLLLNHLPSVCFEAAFQGFPHAPDKIASLSLLIWQNDPLSLGREGTLSIRGHTDFLPFYGGWGRKGVLIKLSCI